MGDEIKRDVIVIGASAGGVEAFSFLLEHLPADLPAAVGMTLHRSPVFPSILPDVLNRNAKLRCCEPKQGAPFAPGHAYVAPPDHHMLVREGLVRIERGPKHHHSRPAIDPLFQSVAVEYGSRVIGVLLTGNLSDGVAGLIAIKNHGGLCLTQDPADAPYPSMPQHALAFDHVDVVFRLRTLPNVLQALVAGERVARARVIAGLPEQRA